MDHIISRFCITKLFGCQEIELTISNNELILIGENGSGKTTVMSMFYHMLKGDFKKLNKYNFGKVELEFTSGDTICIGKYDLEVLAKYRGRNSSHNIKRRLSNVIRNTIEFKKVIEEIECKELKPELIDNNVLSKRLGYDDHKWKQEINRDFKMLISHPEVTFGTFDEILKSNIGQTEILYFPTYRRVEEDLKNIEINRDIEDEIEFDFEATGNSDIPIQFGMSDVNEKFNDIKSEVSRLSSKALTNLSGEILRQLVRGGNHQAQDLSRISKSDIEVVLARLGTMFDENDKRKIIELVEKGKYPDSDHLLISFLSKLIEVYGEQKEIDQYTDKFVDVCNSYLEQTKLVYDKSNVDIYVYSDKTKDKISLNSLSSGEQQIVSLFSKIYLTSNKSFIVLFDEPELSLSIFWQMSLLPDIVASEKCKLLIAVTHSPFIYDNNLSNRAKNLSDFIKPSEESLSND